MTAPEIRDLYAAAPSEFTARRNALSTELRKAGHTAEADAVKALRKPKVSEHALNSAARAHPELIAALASAADDASVAQSAAIGGTASSLREATTTLRKASAAVVEAAVSALKQQGGNGETQRDEITSVLRDLVSADALQQLADGVLGASTIDMSTELFAGAPEPPPAPLQQDTERQRRRAELSRLETQRKRTEAEIARLEPAVEAARTAVAKAESQLADVLARMRAAQEEADTIAARMAELE